MTRAHYQIQTHNGTEREDATTMTNLESTPNNLGVKGKRLLSSIVNKTFKIFMIKNFHVT